MLSDIELSAPTGYSVVLRKQLWLVPTAEAHLVDTEPSELSGPFLVFSDTKLSGGAEEHLIALMRRHVWGYPDYFTTEIAGQCALAASWTDGVRSLVSCVLDVGTLLEVDFSWSANGSLQTISARWDELVKHVRAS